MSITEAEMRDLLAAGRTYTLLVLRDGPASGSPDAPAVVWQHGKRNLELKQAGQMPIVCAVDDGTDLCGIAVLDLDLEQAKEVLEGDPGVQAGVFTYELHTTMSFPGSVLPGPR